VGGLCETKKYEMTTENTSEIKYQDRKDNNDTGGLGEGNSHATASLVKE
jgi:hypothetical protein